MNQRRDFVRLILLGSGATYAIGFGGCRRPPRVESLTEPVITTHTPQFQVAHAYLRDRQSVPVPERTESVDILVVGGGISGLAAAAAIEREGRSATIVESDLRVGGAAQSAPLANGSIPLGSVYFVESSPAMQLLLSVGGIEPVVCPEDGYDFGDGRVVRNLWADSVLDENITNRQDRDGMKRFRDTLLGLGERMPLYPLPPILDTWQAALDVPAEEWVKSFGSPTLMTILNAYARSSMGALLSRTNVYCLQNFYASEFGEQYGTQRYTFPGGPGVLTSAVASKLHDVRSHHVCVRLRKSGTQAEADCVDGEGRVIRYRARAVVMAGPKFQVPTLIEGLPQDQQEACSQLAYAPYITIHLVSDQPLTQAGLYDTWNLTSDSETDVVSPGSVPGTQLSSHVSSLFVPMDSFARGQLQNPELFARRVADISRHFLATRSEDQRASVHEIYAWGWGHGLVVPTPGSHSGPAQRAARSFGPIVFANADCDAAPAMEGAASHGVRAAEEAVRMG